MGLSCFCMNMCRVLGRLVLPGSAQGTSGTLEAQRLVSGTLQTVPGEPWAGRTGHPADRAQELPIVLLGPELGAEWLGDGQEGG